MGRRISVCNDVGGWGCLISISVFLMGTASRGFMYIAPIFASVADDMTAFYYFCDGVDGAVVVGEFCVGCHERMSSRSASRL